MAFFQCNFHSEALGMAVSANVLMPDGPAVSQIGMGGKAAEGLSPVLYLLHGLSDDHTIWMRRTSIERYVAEYGIAVVMPAGGRSFYCNTADGARYFDYIADELPRKMSQYFRISTKREDTFAAGLSMGGYGALKLGFTYPERYGAVAGLSSAMTQEWLQQTNPALYHADFGDTPVFAGSPHDPCEMAKAMVARGATPPRVFLAAGTEDGLYPQSVRLYECLNKLNVPCKFLSRAGGHNWIFWDARIQEVLGWLGKV